ncbi:amidohydrolase [Taklimakanibacter deserti]|uniref:amidohydrolase n=1 Tax=Taklimakanibacter deserti TaxID=2267839 RepID=UPI0034D448C4
MYDGPIIDAHHHLWDYGMGKHRWLMPVEGATEALGSLAPLRRDYLVADYLKDAAGHNVVGTVHIEAQWQEDDALGETLWLEGLDKTQDVALRYVARAPLGAPEARDVIARQAAIERVAGIRAILSHHPTLPQKSFITRPDLAYDKDWRRDIGLLSEAGLHLELMMYPYQGEAVFDVAQAFPQLQIIVNHCGSPIDRNPAGLQRWRDALRLVASRPNVALKISNPGAYDHDWTPQSIRGVVQDCLDAFGVERAMFGTDYPVAALQMSYGEIYQNFKEAVAHLSGNDQRALFHDNARRFYRF